MEPRITVIPHMMCIGMKTEMSFRENTTAALWREFMPRREEVLNQLDDNLYSIEVYPKGFFSDFDENAPFEKWAAVRVSPETTIPNDMFRLMVPGGKYAVFTHYGPASKAEKTYTEFFEEWLPTSGFIIAPRPHLAIMDHRYKHEQEDSEEDIFIPITKKSRRKTK